MSIVEICKLSFKFLFFGLICFNLGCSEGALKKRNSLHVGGSFSLLTIDQYSVNGLGDSLIYSLIYDDVFKIKGTKLVSKFLEDIRINKKALAFIVTDKNLFKSLSSSYQEGVKSVLWSPHFKKFKLTTRGLVNMGEGTFEDLKIISSYWKLKGESYGAYKVKGFIKNQRIELVSKKNKTKIFFYRVKSQSQGIKSVAVGKIDIYINNEVIDLRIIQQQKNLNFLEDKSRKIFLRLYKKQEKPHYLRKTILEQQSQNKKLLSKSFKEIKRRIKSKPFNYKSLKVLYNTRWAEKLLDTWAPIYKAKTGKEISYESLPSSVISKKLSKGSFDYYLSLDVESIEPELYYESFHTLGIYNSFRVGSKDLDQVLTQKKKSWSLRQRERLNKKAIKSLSRLPFVTLEFEAPLYKYIIRSEDSLEELKFNFESI